MRISVGMDVAKAIHRARAVDEAGRALLDRAVGNTPEGIASFAADLRTLGGKPVIGLDVVGSFARCLGASLLAEGFRLVHARGIAVNRAGQGLAGGERKSDPRDARTIADLVCTRELRPILPDDETVTAIRLKVGRRRDLVEEQTRRICRLRGLLSSIHPGLGRDLDVTCKGPLVLPTRSVTPAEVRQAGKRRILAHLAKTPHVQGADAPASAAGLAPVIRQSGRKAGWRRTYGRDKALKRVFYQGAFCAVCRKDPLSKAFYDRKRREGKHHAQALVALARRRVTVLWAMIQRRQTCDPLIKAA